MSRLVVSLVREDDGRQHYHWLCSHGTATEPYAGSDPDSLVGALRRLRLGHETRHPECDCRGWIGVSGRYTSRMTA